MSAARQSHAAPVLMTAQRGGEAAPTPAKMSLYDLMGRFWQLDAERPFTANETRLYFYWLNQFNAARWADSLPRRPLQVCADLGLTDKTLVVARVGLVSRGLMRYTEGHRRLSAIWSLGGEPADRAEESRNNSGLQAESAPRKSGNIPANKGGKTAVIPQESRKNSGDIYKEEEKTLGREEKTPTVAADAAAGEPGKKIGLSKTPDVLTSSLDKLQREASHTEGGAADVATSIQPGKPAKVPPDEAPGFLAFWQVYPRPDGKLKAAQSFARLNPDEQAQATELAPAFFARRTDWIAPDGTDYRPYAATWLNGKRWKEAAEPLPAPSPAATTSHASPQGISKPGTARHHVPQVTSYGKL